MKDLTNISRRINDREEAIGILKSQTLNKAFEALTEVLLQGADLLMVKASMRYGQWLPWLAEHCPGISARSAQDYMRLAKNPQRAADLLAAGSIKRALSLLSDSVDDKSKESGKRWPAYMEAIGRLGKLNAYVSRFPIDQWPNEGLDKFRSDFQPIAERLWPEKFTASKP